MDISGILLRGWKEREEKRMEDDTNFCEKGDRFMNLNVTYPPIEIKKELLKEYNQVTFPYSKEEIAQLFLKSIEED